MDNMDSIEVRIPDEIREYKEKYGGFTFRQWIGIVLVGVVCVPVYYVLYTHTVQTFAMIVTTIIAAPIGLIFFMPINGMNAEKMIPYFKRMFIDFGTVLKFETENERKIELEMMKDKKYRKKIKKLKKLELKNRKKIERGSVDEENEKLRACRADVDMYYKALRKEKIDKLISSKVSDISIGLNRRELKKLKKETSKLQNNVKNSKFISDLELEKTFEDESSQAIHDNNSCQSESITNPLEDKAIFVKLEENDSNENVSHFKTGELEPNDVLQYENSKLKPLTSNQEHETNDNGHDSIETGRNNSTVNIKDESSDLSEKPNIKEIVQKGEKSNKQESEDLDKSEQNTQGVVNSNEVLSKRQQVLRYYRTHPYATKADCKAATGIEMRTIKRCWPKD